MILNTHAQIESGITVTSHIFGIKNIWNLLPCLHTRKCIETSNIEEIAGQKKTKQTTLPWCVFFNAIYANEIDLTITPWSWNVKSQRYESSFNLRDIILSYACIYIFISASCFPFLDKHLRQMNCSRKILHADVLWNVT